MTIKLLTEYTYNGDQRKTALRCEDPTLAQQQFKDQCDINILMARYLETGEMPQVQDGLTYGNFEGIFDFQTAMNAVRTAEELFSQFPARIKNRFDNNPQNMIGFLSDPENREEAEFLGLIAKQETPLNEPGPESLPREATQDRPEPRRASPSKGEAQADENPGPKTPQTDKR